MFSILHTKKWFIFRILWFAEKWLILSSPSCLACSLEVILRNSKLRLRSSHKILLIEHRSLLIKTTSELRLWLKHILLVIIHWIKPSWILILVELRRLLEIVKHSASTYVLHIEIISTTTIASHIHIKIIVIKICKLI